MIGLNTKVVPPQGDTLAGQFVPGGTNIAVNPWALMRHEPTFGKDVDVFRPERFINASPEERASMQRTVDLMFGAGRFMCAGKTVAWMELNKIFVEVCLPYLPLSSVTTKPRSPLAFSTRVVIICMHTILTLFTLSSSCFVTLTSRSSTSGSPARRCCTSSS